MATVSSDSDQDNLSYEDKLYQVFISCDTSGLGLLNKDGILVLCDKLQLDDDQTLFVLDHLIDDRLSVQVCSTIGYLFNAWYNSKNELSY